MAHEDIATAERKTLSVRAGSSRKLLQRKAAERAVMASACDALENSFPPPTTQEQEQSPEPQGGSSSGPAAAPALVPAGTPAWSSEDEAALQAILARRRAAGYQRRGKDVGQQRLRPGEIKPNADTVVATIVTIVAERGELGRSALLDLMAESTFLHPKAQPQDKGWCQGYVAGAYAAASLPLCRRTLPLVKSTLPTKARGAEMHIVSYLRVSTAKQGLSGLGLEAQRAAVSAFAKAGAHTITAEYVEVESGAKAARPQLVAALTSCRLHRATLVIAKLDRLARNVAFIANLMDGGVKFVACGRVC